MQKFSRRNLKKFEFMVVASLVLFVALTAVAAVFAGLGDVWTVMRGLEVPVLAGLLVLSLVNYSLRGFRWHVCGRRLGVQVSLKRLALYYSAGFSMVTTPGKVGTALRLWFLKRCHNYRYANTAPLMFMDQFTDMLAMVLLAGIGAMGFHGYGVVAVFLIALVVALGLVCARPGLLVCLVKWLYARLGKPKKRLFATLLRIIRRIAHLFSPRLLTTTTLLSLVGWGAEVVAFWWLLDALGAPLPLLAAMFIFAFATIVGGISMLPGGLGGAEATMFGLLVAMDIPADIAVAATAIIRLTTLWFGVVIGFVMLPLALRLAR